jgi:hypothetical protein
MNELPIVKSPSTTTGVVSEWIGQATQIVTGIAGASYAFGWLLTARFYGALDVDPEEVGITFSWLVIRAFLIGLLGLLVVLGARKLLELAARSRPFNLFVRSRVAIAAALLLACIGMAGIVALAYVVWLAPGNTDPTGAIVAIFGCGVLVGLAVLRLRPSSFNFQWNGRYWLRGTAGALLGFLVVSLVFLPFRLGDRLAAEVRAGRPVTVDVLPGVPAITAIEVRVTSVDPVKPSPASGCILRLGDVAGTSLFMIDRKVLRVSDQNVIVTSPC